MRARQPPSTRSPFPRPHPAAGRLPRPRPSSFAGADALGLPSLAQAIKGEDITVYGEGQQTRSFCYVDDLVDGLIRLMNQEVCCRGAAPAA